jgi:hypothetical protein
MGREKSKWDPPKSYSFNATNVSTRYRKELYLKTLIYLLQGYIIFRRNET